MTTAGSRPAVLGPEHRPAGIVTRVVAAGADLALVIVMGSLVYAGVAGARLVWSPTTFAWPEPPFWLVLGVEAFLAVSYLTAAWAISGRTYGSSLMGVRVLSHRRGPLGWTRSFLRAVFCVFFPIGLFWVVVSPNRRSVQDLVLRTIVVYDWRGAV